MFRKIISISTVASLCLLVVLLNTTTPVTAGPFGVLAIFISIYILALGLFTFVIFQFSHLVCWLSHILMARAPISRLTLKRSYYFATVIAAIPVMIIGLQSVGTIGLYEITLTALFGIIGCLYVSKRIR